MKWNSVKQQLMFLPIIRRFNKLNKKILVDKFHYFLLERPIYRHSKLVMTRIKAAEKTLYLTLAVILIS